MLRDTAQPISRLQVTAHVTPCTESGNTTISAHGASLGVEAVWAVWAAAQRFGRKRYCRGGRLVGGQLLLGGQQHKIGRRAIGWRHTAAEVMRVVTEVACALTEVALAVAEVVVCAWSSLSLFSTATAATLVVSSCVASCSTLAADCCPLTIASSASSSAFRCACAACLTTSSTLARG